MPKITVLSVVFVSLLFLAAAPAVFASSADTLQPASSDSLPAGRQGGPASTITYNEDLTVNNTVRVNSIHVGQEGTGGVTYFNGSVLNAGATTPFTIADDVRIDGGIWRGASKGTSDDMPLKIYDTMAPGLNNANDLGSASLKWKDLYLAGTVTTSGLQGTGIVSSGNIADGTVATADIADGAVISATIADGSITGDDIAADANLAVNEVNWNTAKTGYVSVSKSGCIGDNIYMSNADVTGAWSSDGTGHTNMYWSVDNLPHNATIKSFTGHLIKITGSTSNMDCNLVRTSFDDSFTLTTLATVSTTSLSGQWDRVTDSSVSNATVDNSNYSYEIHCSSKDYSVPGATELTSDGFIIEYEKTFAD